MATLARALQGIDVACYGRHGRDPLQPLIGLGPVDAPLCFVGRDPGAAEVAQWRPFVGGSGQQIRRALAAHRSALVALTHPELEALGNNASGERFQSLFLRFEATLQVRNKLLSAYKDIMSMPV